MPLRRKEYYKSDASSKAKGRPFLWEEGDLRQIFEVANLYLYSIDDAKGDIGTIFEEDGRVDLRRARPGFREISPVS